MPDSDPTPRPHADRPLLGIALRFGSASCFAIMAAALKLASLRGVTAPEMILYRNGFGLPLVLLWVLSGPGLRALATRRPLAHLTRSGIGLVSMLLTFQAIILLPPAEATTITFTAPVFATILSVIVLSEVVGRFRWCAVALAAAVGQAAVSITLRQISRTEGIAPIVFWFTVATTLAGAATLPWFGQRHDAVTWGLLVAAGLIGGSGQIMMTASLRHAPVAVVAPLDYVQILWATLFGWILLAHPPTATTLVGAAMIAGGGLLTAWREQRLRRTVAATVRDQ